MKNKKYLIINADDFGMSSEFNQAICVLMTQGIVSSTSLMANGRVYEEAIQDTHRSKSLFRNHISQYIDNRILRLELVDNIIQEKFPHLQKYSIYHCIFYYNELIGRVCLFPNLYHDPRIFKVISYIKNHSVILKTNHQKFGFSKAGAYLIIYLPQALYLHYRLWKSREQQA